MSKLYFAKFLAVEGEIKEGDIILQYQHNKGKYRRGIASSGKYINGERKVKLFLCSRDIQAGDTVTDGKGNYNRVDNNPNITGLEIASRQGWFKVIGEISPDAIWVKDGDEFDRNDFEMRWTNSKGENSLTMADVNTEETSPRLVAYFQCPTCKHYH